MIKARFYLPFEKCDNDYRPVIWPVKYPYWCTGETTRAFIIVAYLDDISILYDQWPELKGLSDSIVNLDWEYVENIEYTDRFQRPNWYTDEYIKEYDPSKVKVYWTGKKEEKKSKRERFIEKFGHWWYIRDLDFLPQPCEDYMKAFKMDGKWLDLVNEGKWKAFNNLEEARKASNIIRKAMGMKEYIFK